MMLTGIRPNGGKIGIWGIKIKVITSRITYPKQLIISLAGSLANFLTGFFGSESLKMASIAYGFFNLIPITALDGGEVLSTVLYMFGAEPYTVTKILYASDMLFTVILWMTAVYFALKFGAPGLLISTVYLLFAAFMSKGLD